MGLGTEYPVAQHPSELVSEEPIMIWIGGADEYEQVKYFDSFIVVYHHPRVALNLASLCWRSHSIKMLITIRKPPRSAPVPIPTHIIREAQAVRVNGRRMIFQPRSRTVDNVCGLSYAELAIVGSIPMTDHEPNPMNWARSVLGRDLLVNYDDIGDMRRTDQPQINSCWLKLNPNEKITDTPKYFP